MYVVRRVERLPTPLLCIAPSHMPSLPLRLAPKLLATVANPQLMAPQMPAGVKISFLHTMSFLRCLRVVQ